MNKAAAIIGAMLAMLIFVVHPLAAQEVDGAHVDAELIAETTAAVPGEILWTAVRLEHLVNWHTYWINPGDAGMPTRINWQLPAGVTAGAITWPVPERFDLPGDVVDFGYTGEIFLLVPLSVPADFSATTLDARARVDWLECEEICIPAGADLSLSVPVSAQASASVATEWQQGFAQTRASLPRADITLDANFSLNNGAIELLVQATENIFENARSVTFIPDQNKILDYTADQQLTTQLSSLQLRQNYNSRVERQMPERVGGLLLVTGADGRQLAYQVDAEPSGVNTGQLGGALAAVGGAAAVNADMPLLTVFFLAMLGGFILNLMPCVFPVLSLKVMSLAAHSNYSQHQQRMHGVSYTAGVISAFLILAGVLLTLQASGAAIGWGFHLQTPWFVGALVFLFFVMGLSMSGVVEFGTGVMGVGTNLQEKEGYAGSFFTGVLASVVASPCTAPFMGAALGFAFTQAMPVALTVFVALGFGMALPFLVISFVPGLARRMPRPGHWMLTFKQILAFPLYATAAWLLWVLGQQTSSDAMALVIGGCLALAFAAWLYHQRHITKGGWRYVSTLLILASLITSFSVLRSPFLATRTAGAGAEDAVAEANYRDYSDALLADLRRQGKPVFVNMTASWCITCLVNEKVALSSDAVINALAENDVTYLKGDWTNNDPAITAVLKQYETSGVPLYLMFPADASKPAEVLPQILTEGIVMDALTRI